MTIKDLLWNALMWIQDIVDICEDGNIDRYETKLFFKRTGNHFELSTDYVCYPYDNYNDCSFVEKYILTFFNIYNEADFKKSTRNQSLDLKHLYYLLQKTRENIERYEKIW